MKTVLVGCGRMGGAMLRGWRAVGVAPVFVVDPGLTEAEGAEVLDGLDAVLGLGGPLCVMIAVKPAMAAGVLTTLAPCLGPDSLVLSVAAGVTLAQMRAAAGEGPALVRTMPNTAAAIGKGAVGAVSDRALAPNAHAFAQKLLEAAGEVFWLEDERRIDAVTAISGSGPAYYYRFTEAMARAGEALGLTPNMARRLAELTFTGSAALMEATTKPADALRTEVTSPNGVTAAALAVFDQDDRLDRLVGQVTAEAVRRSQEMSRG